MQINRRYVQTINGRDLFFEILYHWRSILIIALLAAALLGGYSFLSTRNSGSGKTGSAGNTENYATENVRKNVEAYESVLKGYSQYRKESLMLQIDPFNEYFVNAVYEIVPEDDTATDRQPEVWVASYRTSVYGQMEPADLMDVFGTDKVQYIREIASVEAGMFSASTKLTEGELRTLSVQVTAPNAEDGDKWMAYVQQIVEGPLHDYVAQRVGAHELRFLTKGSEMRVDTSLLSKIESYSKTITTDQTAYETNKKQVTTDAASGAKKLTRAARIRQILKMAAGGFAVGLLLAAIWYFFRYVFRGVVQDGADLILGYDLAVYGEATASRARKSGKGLDRLIEKWERGGSDTDPTAAWGRIATLVDTNHGEERLLMTGPVSTEALEKAMEGLRPRVHSTKLEKEAEMLTNGRAVTASAEADAVLLVVEKHKTKLAELRRAAEILQINRAKVAGCILV